MNILARKISRFALAAAVATSLIGAPIALATSASAATSVSVVAKKTPVKHKVEKKKVVKNVAKKATVKKYAKKVKPVKRSAVVRTFSVVSARSFMVRAAQDCNTPNRLICSQRDENGNFDPSTLGSGKPLIIFFP